MFSNFEWGSTSMNPKPDDFDSNNNYIDEFPKNQTNTNFINEDTTFDLVITPEFREEVAKQEGLATEIKNSMLLNNKID